MSNDRSRAVDDDNDDDSVSVSSTRSPLLLQRLLLGDIQVVQNVLHTLVHIVGNVVAHNNNRNNDKKNDNDDDDDGLITIERDGIPLLHFLHCVESKTWVDMILLHQNNTSSNNSSNSKSNSSSGRSSRNKNTSTTAKNGGATTHVIIEHLSVLVESIPQMHSYPVMELVLTFLQKIRFHVLTMAMASIEKKCTGTSTSTSTVVVEEPQDKKVQCIDFVRRLFGELSTTLIHDIEHLDPPLSRNVLDQLHGSHFSHSSSTRISSRSSRKDIVAWSRSIISGLECPHVSSFSCNGIYAPRNAEDIGTQIAKIKWVDVNKDSISFFHVSNSMMSESSSSTTTTGNLETNKSSSSCHSFPHHQLITIPFEYFMDNSNRAILCDKDCALTLPLSSSKFIESRLWKLLSHDGVHLSGFLSNHSNDGKKMDLNVAHTSNKKMPDCDCSEEVQQPPPPSCIKIFIRRSEYANFVTTLREHRKSLNIAMVEQSEDASSTCSNIETVFSRSMRRNDEKTGHIQVRLSTKLAPKQMIDAARLIHARRSSSQDDESRRLSLHDDGEMNTTHQRSSKLSLQSPRLSTKCPATNYSPIQNPSTPSPQSTVPMEVAFYPPNDTTRSSRFHPPLRKGVAEITPLQQMNLNAPTNFERLSYNCRRPLETLSAVWGTFEQSKMKLMSFQEFVNHSHVQETADSIISFEQTMAKATKVMNELAMDHQRMMKNLKGGPNERKMGKKTDWIQRTVETVQESAESWAQMRQSYEHDIAKTLWCQEKS